MITLLYCYDNTGYEHVKAYHPDLNLLECIEINKNLDFQINMVKTKEKIQLLIDKHNIETEKKQKYENILSNRKNEEYQKFNLILTKINFIKIMIKSKSITDLQNILNYKVKNIFNFDSCSLPDEIYYDVFKYYEDIPTKNTPKKDIEKYYMPFNNNIKFIKKSMKENIQCFA